jgi:hypothetical protein
LKKAGLADKYGKSPRESIGGPSKKGKKAAAAVEPEKNPQLVIDGDKMLTMSRLAKWTSTTATR